MTFGKIRYFLKVVELGSFTRAAVALGVAQPTLSQQIASLEALMGRSLLVRGGQGATVTEAGRIFFRHAQNLERQMRVAEEEVRSVREEEGNISLGLATCGAASTLALPVLQEVLRDHPGLCLSIHDNFAGSLSELITTGRIDLALVYGPGPSRGVRFERLFSEELFLFAPPVLAGRGRGATSLGAHADLPFVLPSEVHFLRPVIERACARAGFRPRVVAEIDSLSEIGAALRAGVGATILPRSAIDAAWGADGPVGRPIRPERLETTVSLCTSSQLPFTSGIEAVRGIILRLVRARLARRAWRGISRVEALAEEPAAGPG